MRTATKASAGGIQYALSLGSSDSVLNEDGSINREALKSFRKKTLRMSQEEFALLMGLSVSTYKTWEKESEKQKRNPSGPSIALLRIATARPDVIREVFGAFRELTDDVVEEDAMTAQ